MSLLFPFPPFSTPNILETASNESLQQNDILTPTFSATTTTTSAANFSLLPNVETKIYQLGVWAGKWSF